jgi:hypothetical protein
MNSKNLSNVALYFLLSLLFIFPLKAQPQWNGPLNTTGDIYRSGKVGIGFLSAPTFGATLDINGTLRTNNTISLFSSSRNYVMTVRLFEREVAVSYLNIICY